MLHRKIFATRQIKHFSQIAIAPSPQKQDHLGGMMQQQRKVPKAEQVRECLKVLGYTVVVTLSKTITVGDAPLAKQNDQPPYRMTSIEHKEIADEDCSVHLTAATSPSLAQTGHIGDKQERLQSKSLYAVGQVLHVITAFGGGTAEVMQIQWDIAKGWQYAFKKGEDALWLEEDMLQGMVLAE